MEQERLHVGAARRKRRLQDGAGDGAKGVLPFPAEVAVELLQMIEVVLDTDRVVVARPHVEHHAALARYAVEEAGEVGHVREIGRQLRDQQGDVDAFARSVVNGSFGSSALGGPKMTTSCPSSRPVSTHL